MQQQSRETRYNNKNLPFIAPVAMQLSYTERDSNSN